MVQRKRRSRRRWRKQRRERRQHEQYLIDCAERLLLLPKPAAVYAVDLSTAMVDFISEELKRRSFTRSVLTVPVVP
jgi:hypothetical protein